MLTPKNEANRVYDGSLVMGNLMLAAHALGLGSIWIHRAREEFEQAENYRQLLKRLGIEGEWEGIGHCAIGYIDGEAPAAAPRKPGRVYCNRLIVRGPRGRLRGFLPAPSARRARPSK